MKVLIHTISQDAVIPSKGSSKAAGYDLYSISQETILPGETKLIHTGLTMAIEDGYAGFIFARSGLSTKEGLAPANKVGVIDSDYRGEIMVSLYNQSDKERTVTKGERIAQLIFLRVDESELVLCDSLDETERGQGGFGSTGKE